MSSIKCKTAQNISILQHLSMYAFRLRFKNKHLRLGIWKGKYFLKPEAPTGTRTLKPLNTRLWCYQFCHGKSQWHGSFQLVKLASLLGSASWEDIDGRKKFLMSPTTTAEVRVTLVH